MVFRRPEAVLEDPEIIQRILKGDKDLFGELVQRHETALIRLCLGILGDPHQAEEAAQEIFLKAYRSLDRFKGEAAFRTWLTRIGINHCRDLLRRRNRRKFLSLDAILGGKENPPEALIERPGEEPVGLEKAKEIMARLSEGDREILSMKELEDLNYVEIGSVLGLSLDAVKGRLKRARTRVRHLLKIQDVQ
jgi:RNA polymerase sigma-70 factor (ECF subfamily)